MGMDLCLTQVGLDKPSHQLSISGLYKVVRDKTSNAALKEIKQFS